MLTKVQKEQLNNYQGICLTKQDLETCLNLYRQYGYRSFFYSRSEKTLDLSLPQIFKDLFQLNERIPREVESKELSEDSLFVLHLLIKHWQKNHSLNELSDQAIVLNAITTASTYQAYAEKYLSEHPISPELKNLESYLGDYLDEAIKYCNVMGIVNGSRLAVATVAKIIWYFHENFKYQSETQDVSTVSRATEDEVYNYVLRNKNKLDCLEILPVYQVKTPENLLLSQAPFPGE